MAPNPERELTAIYVNDTLAPVNRQMFTLKLPAPAGTDSHTTAAAYIAGLRESVVQLQGDINGFLTCKMEEDGRRTADAGRKGQSVPGEINEKLEEENYGEEVEQDAQGL